MYAVPPPSTSRAGQGVRKHKHTCRGGLYFRRQCLVAFIERLYLLREIFELVLRERLEITLIGNKKSGLS
jgi:hypothetical protein